MSDTPESKLVDKRVAHRYVKSGLLDEKNYERYLKNLPDVTEKAESVASSIYESEDNPQKLDGSGT